MEKRIICALAASHYQHDLIEGWLEKWRLSTQSIEIEERMLNVWEVEAPDEAFRELPADVMAYKYRRVLWPHMRDVALF
jgi:hypothetical protein